MDLNNAIRQHIEQAYTNAPAIRRILDEAGVKPSDIQTVDDLGRLPVTSKDRLVELQQANPPFGGFLGVPMAELTRIYISPGPIYDPQGIHDEIAAQSAKEALSEMGFSADDLVLNTFMYHLVPAGLLLDESVRMLGATVIPTGPGNTEIQIKIILDLKVTAYIGTPSFLELIYEKAEQMGIPALPIKKAFFTAEPYRPSQREIFEGKYKLVTGQAYTTADLGIIGYEKPGEAGLIVPQNLIVQICDPETGEILENGSLGEVVVTSLSPVYPLTRFGTGDLSILDIDANGRRRLRGWLGRSGDAIKVRGMFLHPNALQGAIGAFPNIQKFQAVIGRDGARDVVTLQIILSEGEIDEKALIQAVEVASRLSVNRVEVVNEIEGSRLVRDTRSYN